jgi:hypothetical protein
VGVFSRLPYLGNTRLKYLSASYFTVSDRERHASLMDILPTLAKPSRRLAMSSYWIITTTCVLVLVPRSFTHPTSTDMYLTSQDILALSPREEPCPGIEGNSDLYGLGIRIGVYLQWFSAWISNTMNPSGAASNHDANTIFLTAILIATTVALAGGEIQPVEAYIMLLLSSGFVFTVLSFLGIRLHFLRPSSTRRFRETLSTIFKNLMTTFASLEVAVLDLIVASVPERTVRAKQRHPFITTVKRLVLSAHMTFGLKSISELKHPALSWAGVVGRCAIGTFSAVVSILVWWQYSTQSLPNGAGSCTPIFFFFGLRSGTGSMLWFFRVAAILLTFPVAYPLNFALSFMSEFGTLGGDWLFRYRIIKMAEAIKPGSWDTLSDEEKQSLRELLRPQTLISAGQPLVVNMDTRSLLHLLQSISGKDPITPPPAGAPHDEISSMPEQPHQNGLPHDEICDPQQSSNLTDAPRTDAREAVSHGVDAQKATGTIEIAGKHQRHLETSESRHTAESGTTQDKSSWQIKASELPRFSVLLQSFMSLWARGTETDTRPGTDKVIPQ